MYDESVMNIIYEGIGINIEKPSYIYLNHNYFYGRLNENDNIIKELDEFGLDILSEDIKDMGKAIWQKIVAVFKKIMAAFKNFILNINYLKNAKLPKQQVDDLLYCLNVSQNRSFNYVKTFTRFYKISTFLNVDPNREVSYGATNGLSDNRAMYVTTLNDELINNTQEISKNLESLENSKEYDRLKENNYEKENLVDVPLTNIVKDMKRCNKELADAEGQLPQCVRLADKFEDNPTWKDVSKKMVVFLKKVISYFTTRIKLLNTFFKSAKLSVKAIKNNIMDSKKFQSYIDTNPNMKNFRKFLRPTTVKAKYGLVNDLITKMRESNNNGNFDEYNDYYKKLANILHVKDGSSFVVTVDSHEIIKDGGTADPEKEYTFGVKIMEYDYKTIKFGSKPLFHQASDDSITELIPTAISNGGFLFHRTGRVYVHLSIPLNRYGSNAETDIKIGYDYDAKSTTMYKVKDNIKEGFLDPELARTAVFIETKDPIRVEKISMDEYRKEVEKYFN